MNAIIENKASKLELHYFFSDNSNFMDAFIRNKCEAEILSIIKEITTIMDIEIDVNSEAFLEGGLREFWEFIGNNSGQIAIVIAIITLIMSRISSSNKKLEVLQIENAKLEQIERELNIEKLKHELNDLSGKKEVKVIIEEVSVILNQDIKITKHKSNFYDIINKYPKITQISTTTYTEQNKKIDEIIVKKNQFDKFIVVVGELPDKKDDTAIIEIISPILKKGKYKWKGIYNKTGQIIDFFVKDRDFKNDVIENKILFKNGTFIDCILRINQKIDEFGDIKNTGYSVITVLNVHDETTTFETPKGKKYRDKKDANKKQYKFKLFVDNKENE